MFPGFVTVYKDVDKHVHLYFFPGLDNSGKYIYRTIDLSTSSFTFKELKNTDGSIDYKFDDKHINEIYCKLIKYDNQWKTEILKI